VSASCRLLLRKVPAGRCRCGVTEGYHIPCTALLNLRDIELQQVIEPSYQFLPIWSYFSSCSPSSPSEATDLDSPILGMRRRRCQQGYAYGRLEDKIADEQSVCDVAAIVSKAKGSKARFVKLSWNPNARCVFGAVTATFKFG
jgi:hypothetical protein